MDLKSLILGADDLPREAVVVPEWGGVTVWVKTMTGTERTAFELANARGRPGKAEAAPDELFRSRLLVRVLCDESGRLIFTEDDVKALGRKSALALDRLVDVAMRLSGIGKRAAEQAEKNSETTPPDGSASA